MPYKDVELAKEGIRHGDVTGALYIPSRFSKSLEDRLRLGRTITSKALNSSQIETWLDMSSKNI